MGNVTNNVNVNETSLSSDAAAFIFAMNSERNGKSVDLDALNAAIESAGLHDYCVQRMTAPAAFGAALHEAVQKFKLRRKRNVYFVLTANRHNHAYDVEVLRGVYDRAERATADARAERVGFIRFLVDVAHPTKGGKAIITNPRIVELDADQNPGCPDAMKPVAEFIADRYAELYAPDATPAELTAHFGKCAIASGAVPIKYGSGVFVAPRSLAQPLHDLAKVYRDVAGEATSVATVTVYSRDTEAVAQVAKPFADSYFDELSAIKAELQAKIDAVKAGDAKSTGNAAALATMVLRADELDARAESAAADLSFDLVKFKAIREEIAKCVDLAKDAVRGDYDAALESARNPEPATDDATDDAATDATDDAATDATDDAATDDAADDGAVFV